jgi:hypothetical protein
MMRDSRLPLTPPHSPYTREKRRRRGKVVKKGTRRHDPPTTTEAMKTMVEIC